MHPEQRSRGVGGALAGIGRAAPWVLLFIVIGAGAAYGVSKLQTKKYTATAALLFNANELGRQLTGVPAASGGISQAQATALRELVVRGDIAAKTAHDVRRGLTARKVRAALRVSSRAESNVVHVAATATSAKLAAEIANKYTREFVAEQRKSSHALYASELRLSGAQLARLTSKQRAAARGVALRHRVRALAVLAESSTGNVEPVHTATVPKSSSSPRVVRNTIFGGVLGLLLGLAAAVVFARRNRWIRTPEDVGRIYGLPILGVVPRSDVLARSPLALAQGSRELLPAHEEDRFRLIVERLRYFKIDRELRTLLVASASPREGKTTIARHLARVAATMGSLVLLVETDLRRPALAAMFGLRPGPGLSDVLIGEASLRSAIQPIDVGSAPLGASPTGSLDVLVAGASMPPNPADLIGSAAMERMLEHAAGTYELIVLDSASLGVYPDAFALLGTVDGVIIVGRVGHKGRQSATRLHDLLEGVREALLGVVANGAKAPSRRQGNGGQRDGYAPASAGEHPGAPSGDDRLGNGASGSGSSSLTLDQE